MQGGKNPKRKFGPHVYMAPNLVLMSRFLFFNTRINSTWVRFCSTIFFPASSARCSFAPLPTWQHMRVNRSVRFSAFTPLFLQIDYHSWKILLKYTMFCQLGTVRGKRHYEESFVFINVSKCNVSSSVWAVKPSSSLLLTLASQAAGWLSQILQILRSQSFPTLFLAHSVQERRACFPDFHKS